MVLPVAKGTGEVSVSTFDLFVASLSVRFLGCRCVLGPRQRIIIFVQVFQHSLVSQTRLGL